MNCLLDTHAFLWSVFAPQRLGRKAAQVAADPSDRVWVSVVTFWEISLKHAVGKLQLENVVKDTATEWAGGPLATDSVVKFVKLYIALVTHFTYFEFATDPRAVPGRIGSGSLDVFAV